MEPVLSCGDALILLLLGHLLEHDTLLLRIPSPPEQVQRNGVKHLGRLVFIVLVHCLLFDLLFLALLGRLDPLSFFHRVIICVVLFALLLRDSRGVEREAADPQIHLLGFIFLGGCAQGLVRVLERRGGLLVASACLVRGGTQENVLEAETLGATAEQVRQSLLEGGAAT